MLQQQPIWTLTNNRKDRLRFFKIEKTYFIMHSWKITKPQHISLCFQWTNMTLNSRMHKKQSSWFSRVLNRYSMWLWCLNRQCVKYKLGNKLNTSWKESSRWVTAWSMGENFMNTFPNNSSLQFLWHACQWPLGNALELKEQSSGQQKNK